MQPAANCEAAWLWLLRAMATRRMTVANFILTGEDGGRAREVQRKEESGRRGERRPLLNNICRFLLKRTTISVEPIGYFGATQYTRKALGILAQLRCTRMQCIQKCEKRIT